MYLVLWAAGGRASLSPDPPDQADKRGSFVKISTKTPATDHTARDATGISNPTAHTHFERMHDLSMMKNFGNELLFVRSCEDGVVQDVDAQFQSFGICPEAVTVHPRLEQHHCGAPVVARKERQPCPTQGERSPALPEVQHCLRVHRDAACREG